MLIFLCPCCPSSYLQKAYSFLRYLNGDPVSCRGALPVEALPNGQHTSYFWKEYILRFLKTPPFKNLKIIFFSLPKCVYVWRLSICELDNRNHICWSNFLQGVIVLSMLNRGSTMQICRLHFYLPMPFLHENLQTFHGCKITVVQFNYI